MNIATIAGAFSSKEAVAKAIGTGFGKISWKEISIIKNEEGRPIVVLTGKSEIICKEKGIDSILITVSHSREYAVAHAIAIGGITYENS